MSSYFLNEIKLEGFLNMGINNLSTTILSGPAKDTIINISLIDNDSGTDVFIDIKLKLIFKAKMFLPIIKKIYKNLLTGIFYKIDNLASEDLEIK